MATGTEQAQTTVPTCPDHKHQLLLSYCRTCHKRICEKCVKGPHSEHDWTFLQNHVRQVRNEGQKIAKEIRKEIIAFLKAKRDGAAKEQEKAKIRRMQQDLKDLIDKYADEMVAQIDDGDDISDVDKEIEEFERWAVFFERDVRTDYDSVVVEMEEEYRDKLSQHKRTKAAAQGKARRFQEGIIDNDKIKGMMGQVEIVDISKLDVTVLNTVTHGESKILGIEAMSEQKAWIHSSGTNKASFVDISGTQLETRRYETLYSDFLVKGNDQVFIVFEEKYIAAISDGKIRKICSTSLHPYGICHSRESGMLVCLTDTHAQEVTPSSKGEVHCMDMTGGIKTRYHQNKVDGTKLLTCPYRVAQNINSDLCVCDILEQTGRSRLVVIKKSSEVRFTYHGQSILEETFYANDVVCDTLGKILLCDAFNDAIHLLSIDGQFIQFLLTADDGLTRPCSLGLCETTMWVGNNKGVIKICKLKQQGKLNA